MNEAQRESQAARQHLREHNGSAITEGLSENRDAEEDWKLLVLEKPEGNSVPALILKSVLRAGDCMSHDSR